MASSGGMTLVRMRDAFRERFPDLSADDSDGVIDEYLNGAHRFAYPNEVDGTIREGVWQFTTAANVATYTFRPSPTGDTWVQSLRGPVWVDDLPIEVTRDRDHYYRHVTPSDTSSGTPRIALVEKDSITFYPRPGTTQHTVRALASIYPAALTTDGLSFRPRALAVVCLAVQEAAMEYGHPDIAARCEAEAGAHLDRCRTDALAMPRPMRRRRDF